ncbi:hypothetical protein CTA2_11158 [Colletotrichum tanaceti]|nr:hypothetical protein CTA2_11158 [Colletotrichum tanaceti]
MKLSSIAIIVTAAAGVAGVPVDSGPLDNLESRAADAIGGVVHYIRREQAGTSVAPVIKRAPPIRFRSVLEHENDLRRRAAQNEPPTPVSILRVEAGGSIAMPSEKAVCLIACFAYGKSRSSELGNIDEFTLEEE